jgi:hypothetical protein
VYEGAEEFMHMQQHAVGMMWVDSHEAAREFEFEYTTACTREGTLASLQGLGVEALCHEQCCTFSRYVAYGRYFINYFAVIGYFIAF